MALAFIGLAVYVVVDLATGPTPVGNKVSVAALFGALSGLTIAFASARMFVRHHTVHVVSFFVTYLIPIAEIVGVDADNGMSIKVTSGRAIGSMAFGSSLIAMVTGNRRGKRAARRLGEIVGTFTASGGNWKQDTVRPHPRWAMLGVGVGVTCVAMLAAAL